MSQVKYQSKKRRDKPDGTCRDNLCSSHFCLRLGGLQANLHFRLRQFKDRVAILELESDQELEARISYVGSDFVEVDVVRMEKVLILPFEEIKDLRFKEDES